MCTCFWTAAQELPLLNSIYYKDDAHISLTSCLDKALTFQIIGNYYAFTLVFFVVCLAPFLDCLVRFLQKQCSHQMF